MWKLGEPGSPGEGTGPTEVPMPHRDCRPGALTGRRARCSGFAGRFPGNRQKALISVGHRSVHTYPDQWNQDCPAQRAGQTQRAEQAEENADYYGHPQPVHGKDTQLEAAPRSAAVKKSQ